MSHYTDPAALTPRQLEARRLARAANRCGAQAAQERAEVIREDESTPRRRSALDAIWAGMK